MDVLRTFEGAHDGVVKSVRARPGPSADVCATAGADRRVAVLDARLPSPDGVAIAIGQDLLSVFNRYLQSLELLYLAYLLLLCFSCPLRRRCPPSGREQRGVEAERRGQRLPRCETHIPHHTNVPYLNPVFNSRNPRPKPKRFKKQSCSPRGRTRACGCGTFGRRRRPQW